MIIFEEIKKFKKMHPIIYLLCSFLFVVVLRHILKKFKKRLRKPIQIIIILFLCMNGLVGISITVGGQSFTPGYESQALFGFVLWTFILIYIYRRISTKEIIFENGSKYKGEMKYGKIHGEGTATYSSGNKYVGEWKDGKMHGQGTYTYADGTVKKGLWENDEFIEE